MQYTDVIMQCTLLHNPYAARHRSGTRVTPMSWRYSPTTYHVTGTKVPPHMSAPPSKKSPVVMGHPCRLDQGIHDFLLTRRTDVWMAEDKTAQTVVGG